MALVTCKECGKEKSSRAEVCPHCGLKQRKTSFLTWLVATFVGVPVLIGVIQTTMHEKPTNQVSQSRPAANNAAPGPKDDLDQLVSVYGTPDRTVSSENEKPRPPIVTKQLIFEKEHLRAVYVPMAPVGSPPPYAKWKFFGFQDQLTNEVVSPKEADRRLSARKKK